MAKKVFNMEGGLHSAAAYAAFENRAYGSCVANDESFVVSAGSGMNANISTGDGLISDDSELARRIQTTDVESVAVSAASGSYDRIDTVVAYIDTSVAPTTSVIDNINDILKFACVAGTAAATPVAPTDGAIQSAIGAGNPYMKLYEITVPQSAVNLSGATFTDIRKFPTLDNAYGVYAGPTYFTSSGTYQSGLKKKAGLKYIIVEVQGAGGGGAGSGTATDQVGSGGGAGGYVVKKILASALSDTTETVTVGAAGSAGSAGASNGGAGGSSSFGSHATAGGGGGGLNGNTAGSSSGGSGGTATGGDFNQIGQGGFPGGAVATIGGAYLRLGYGGSSKLGHGAHRDSPSSNQAGNAGTGYGAGGSGGARIGASNVAGGAGTAGIVIVHEYY